MSDDSAPTAEVLHNRILKAARGRHIVAFALKDAPIATGFVELPLGEPETTHGWVGYWLSADDRDSGIPPLVVVACSPLPKAAELRARLGIARSRGDLKIDDAENDVRRPVPHSGRLIAEFEEESTYVIVLDRSTARRRDQVEIERVIDPEPYILGWYSMASGGRTDASD